MSGGSEGPDGRLATLFDGETAARHVVAVRPLAGGFALSGGAELVLARSELRLVERGARRTVLGLMGRPDWRLVAEPPLPAEWLEDVAPAARLSRKAKRGWALLGAGVAGLAALIWLQGNRLVEAAAPLVPAAVIAPTGVAFVDQLVADNRCSTPEAEAALARLLTRLRADAPAHLPVTVTVTVADFGFANAFAGPGGQVVLTRGLIAQASGPDEVAGVLAHEIGHVAHHHPTRALLRHYGLALFAGSLGGGYADVAQVGLMLASTRDAEREADADALARMRAAGVSSAGLVRFFERQQRTERTMDDGDEGSEMLARIGSYATTHPPDAERLAAFRAAAGPATPALSPADWAVLKTICGVSPRVRSGG